ncbi:hypothetical protein BCV70DRAFT_142636, partial [Testicularia cyperi]
VDAISSGDDGDRGWLQDNVRRLGAYARTSTPAYTLSALFTLSTPFGFATPAQAAAEAAAKLQRQQHMAQASAAATSQGSSGLVARLVANAQARKLASGTALSSSAAAASSAPPRPIAPFWQLAFFALAFGGGGYIIDQGDALNGSGVVTAWSLTYLFFKTGPTFRQLGRNPLALALSSGVLGLGLAIHGSYYFDKLSWKGAVPALADYDQSLERSGQKGKSKLLTFDRPGTSSKDSYTSIFVKPDTSASLDQQTTLPSRQSETSSGLVPPVTHNNDQARAAAFLRRQ